MINPASRDLLAVASHIHSFHKRLSQAMAVAANGLQKRLIPDEDQSVLNREFDRAS